VVEYFKDVHGMSQRGAEVAATWPWDVRCGGEAALELEWFAGAGVILNRDQNIVGDRGQWVCADRHVIGCEAIPRQDHSGRRARQLGFLSARRVGAGRSGSCVRVVAAVYIDHPTVTEQQERPARSVRDLAGRLVQDVTYQDGLYSTVEFFPHWAPIISAMKDDVGLSIRALAEAEPGEFGGRRETVITKITEALSVDVVTKAGAGGKLIGLLESARQGGWPMATISGGAGGVPTLSGAPNPGAECGESEFGADR
jgi:hypothetical protein